MMLLTGREEGHSARLKFCHSSWGWPNLSLYHRQNVSSNFWFFFSVGGPCVQVAIRCSLRLSCWNYCSGVLRQWSAMPWDRYLFALFYSSSCLLYFKTNIMCCVNVFWLVDQSLISRIIYRDKYISSSSSYRSLTSTWPLSRVAVMPNGPVHGTLPSPNQDSVGTGHFRWF